MIAVSVIIPYYNGSKYIDETLSSVFSQSLPPAEIILINDGSSEDESSFLEQYKDKVTLIHQENSGVSSTRNAAINIAKNEWIAFLDQDDLWEFNKLEKQWETIQSNPNCMAVHTAVNAIKDGQVIAEYRKKQLDLDDFLKAHPNPSYLSSTLINKKVIMKSGLFNPILPYSQDRECFIRCSLNTTFHYIDEFLTTRRQHSNNLSGNYFGVWKENVKTNRFYENLFANNNEFKESLKALHSSYFIKALYCRNYHMTKLILKELRIDGFSRIKFLTKTTLFLIKQKINLN